MIDAYLAKGLVKYGPTNEEKPYLKFRRSIYVSKNIEKNEKFSKNNLKIIRPGYGLQPEHLPRVIGRKTKLKIKFATPLKWKHIKK